jgi:hypothetical protein
MSSLGCPIMAAVPAASGCSIIMTKDEGMMKHEEIFVIWTFELHSSFVIRISSLYLNETDRVNERVICASPSFSRDETDIAARSHHVRRNNLQRNPPASVQSPCAS